MSATATSTRARTPGVVSAGECYTVAEFRARTGLRDFAYRQVRKAGLRVIPVGRKRYVRADDWLDFLNKVASGEVSLAEE